MELSAVETVLKYINPGDITALGLIAWYGIWYLGKIINKYAPLYQKYIEAIVEENQTRKRDIKLKRVIIQALKDKGYEITEPDEDI